MWEIGMFVFHFPVLMLELLCLDSALPELNAEADAAASDHDNSQTSAPLMTPRICPLCTDGN